MSDPLDDLGAALSSIEPSVGFDRRVRANIAAADRTRAWRGVWTMAVAAGAMAMVASAIFLRPYMFGTAGPAVKPVPTTAADSSAPAPVEAAPMRSSGGQAGPAATTVRSRRPAPLVVETVWRIPENAQRDQAIAVRHLVRLIRLGTFTAPADPSSNMTVEDTGLVPIPAPIEIAPITIAPLLPPQAGERGGNGR